MKINFLAALMSSMVFLSLASKGMSMDYDPCITRVPFQSPTRTLSMQLPIQKNPSEKKSRRKNDNPMRALPQASSQKRPIQRNLFGDTQPSHQTIGYTPCFYIKDYSIGSWNALNSHHLTEKTALIVDFDGTLARRVYTIPCAVGEPLTIRYAASSEWNSPMYERFFKEALQNIGRTPDEFDQLFKYFKKFISYEVLDPSFSDLDLSNVPHKKVLSGLKDKDGEKSTLSGKSGFSYHDSSNKASKIVQFLREDQNLTHIIFVDNNPENTKDVQKNIMNYLKNLRYPVKTALNIDVFHFNYFEHALSDNKDILQQEISAMFNYIENTLYPPSLPLSFNS